jgi:hypothetical protein
MVPLDHKAWTQGAFNPYCRASIEIIATGTRDPRAVARLAAVQARPRRADARRDAPLRHPAAVRRPERLHGGPGWTDHNHIECGNDHAGPGGLEAPAPMSPKWVAQQAGLPTANVPNGLEASQGEGVANVPTLTPRDPRMALINAFQAYQRRAGHGDHLDELARGHRDITGGIENRLSGRGAVRQVTDGGPIQVQQVGDRAGQARQEYDLGDGRIAHVYFDENGKRSVRIFRRAAA